MQETRNPDVTKLKTTPVTSEIIQLTFESLVLNFSLLVLDTADLDHFLDSMPKLY